MRAERDIVRLKCIHYWVWVESFHGEHKPWLINNEDFVKVVEKVKRKRERLNWKKKCTGPFAVLGAALCIFIA